MTGRRTTIRTTKGTVSAVPSCPRRPSVADVFPRSLALKAMSTFGRASKLSNGRLTVSPSTSGRRRGSPFLRVPLTSGRRRVPSFSRPPCDVDLRSSIETQQQTSHTSHGRGKRHCLQRRQKTPRKGVRKHTMFNKEENET
jgi:hypothetical protein